MKTRISHTIIGLIIIGLSVAAAQLAPESWGGYTGITIHFRGGWVLMLLLFLAACGLRGIARWNLHDFVFSLAMANLVALPLIWHSVPSIGREKLYYQYPNFTELMYLDLFFGVPWMVGFVTGSIWICIKKR